MSDFERIAFEASLRALDKQESLLDELRARTGVLLAAATVAASLLGEAALSGDPSPVLAIVAGVSFLGAVLGSIYVLLPKDDLIFALAGRSLYEGFHEHKDDMAEVYRQLAYYLEGFRQRNDAKMKRLLRAYRLAAGGLVLEVVVLGAMVTDKLL